jgi:hypothetical protein
MLKSGTKEYPFIISEHLFGAVALMYVEIEDSDALHAMALQRMSRTDRDVVEQAKTHGPIAFRMMPGRTHAAEGVLHIALHQQIHCQHHGTGGTPGGMQ